MEAQWLIPKTQVFIETNQLKLNRPGHNYDTHCSTFTVHTGMLRA